MIQVQQTRVSVMAMMLVVLVVLAACGSPPKPVEPTAAEKKIALTVIVKEAIEATLKDASSAKFKDVKAQRATVDGKEVWSVCGQVNAKNSFGAFTGYKPFMANGVFMTRDDLGPEFAQMWRKYCELGFNEGPIFL